MIKKLENVGSNQSEAYSVFMVITKSINSDLILDNIRYIDSGEIYISGRAKSDKSIVSFMDKVRSSEIIEQVTIESMNNNEETGLKEFAVICLINNGNKDE